MGRFTEYYDALSAFGVLNFASLEESGEAHFLDAFARSVRVPVVFDVGANVGDYTRQVLTRSPMAHVLAFEPHPRTFVRLAGFLLHPQVTVLNLALGDRKGELEIFDYRDHDGTCHASPYREVIETLHHAPAVAHRVRASTVAEVCDEYDLRHIDLLKIDTEGHEYAVLQGAEPMIRDGRIDVIHFEFNEMNVISRRFFKDFWDFLPEYDFFRLLPGEVLPLKQYVPSHCEIFAFQNIVCTRKDRPLF